MFGFHSKLRAQLGLKPLLLEDKPDTTTALTTTNVHKKAAETVSSSSRVSWFYYFLLITYIFQFVFFVIFKTFADLCVFMLAFSVPLGQSETKLNWEAETSK